ncbi:AlpA family transcriptional regulator [Massilia sp. RP-1-19]|uniref:AlpA family transcriptional regulator n=1 Tax=Massilia polaris TaxID=2728846 RepID=A0A848HNU1_9BURK|nr:AlpA family transcriptional regulator [Massilia polaris]NML61799.1 AlpA family transcriptional regulator [Massilia polaris]
MNNKEQFLRLQEVISLTGRGRSSIYGDIRENKFPAPIKIGARSVAWPLSTIAAWQQSCINASKP